MNIKILFLSLTILVLTCKLHAQNTREAIPDAAVIERLSQLSPTNGTDTIPSHLVVNVKEKKYRLSNYITSKKFSGKVEGYAENTEEINELISQTPTQKKVLSLINSLRASANYLVGIRFDEADQPLQTRIAYSWGSKDYLKRNKPPGEGDHCTYKIHGLDCSGFIFQLFKMSGVTFSLSDSYAEKERQRDFLHTSLTPYFAGNAFKIQDRKFKLAEIQSGDIIYLLNDKGVAYHILIAFVDVNNVVNIYQSLGGPCRDIKNKTCDNNLNPKHGVIAKQLTAEFLANVNYGCVRIVPQ